VAEGGEQRLPARIGYGRGRPEAERLKEIE
jgi:hypothetical protein